MPHKSKYRTVRKKLSSVKAATRGAHDPVRQGKFILQHRKKLEKTVAAGQVQYTNKMQMHTQKQKNRCSSVNIRALFSELHNIRLSSQRPKVIKQKKHMTTYPFLVGGKHL